MNYFNNVNEIEALVCRLIDKLDSSRTESLELEVGDVRMKLDRHSAPAPLRPHDAPPMPPRFRPDPADTVPVPLPKPEPQPVEPDLPAGTVLTPKEDVELVTINAPLLGVAYAAPAPDAAPFVTVGSKVKKGDIICIIEAMKVMNEIEADRDGEVAEILFENGKMVEYGQPLIAVK